MTGFVSFTCAREFVDLLDPGDLRLGHVVIKRVAVVKLGVCYHTVFTYCVTITAAVLLETSASHSMNPSPFLIRSPLCPKLAITIFVSVAVSIHTSIPKQLPPSPLPLCTPSLTTATLFHTTCPSLRSPGSNRSTNSLAHVKLTNPVISLLFYGLCTG